MTILPLLPRVQCPASCLRTISRYGSKRDIYVTRTPCTGRPLANGWCIAHQSAQQFLDIGATLGYPRVEVGTQEMTLWVGCGPGHWEANACIWPRGQLEAILQAARLLEKPQEACIVLEKGD